jgi:hypothetical protein
MVPGAMTKGSAVKVAQEETATSWSTGWLS